MHEIVMSLGEAVVLRWPDGSLTLRERDSRVGIGLQGDRPARAPAGGRVAVAGRLPRGVAAVTVIDDVGAEHAATIQGELWMGVVDAFSEELVRYVGADGELVSTVPAGEHLPITDAREACPVCTAVQWVQVEDTGMTLVTCGRCGFVVCGVGGPPLDTTGWPRRARSRSRKRGGLLSEVALTNVPFGIYGPVTNAARVLSRMGQGAELVSIELIDAADAVTVISSLPARSAFAAVSLQDRLARASHPHTDDLIYSIPASTIRRAAERRAAGRLARAATPDTRAFPVDGELVAFEFLDTGAGWGARCEHQGTEIVVTARGSDPATLALKRVPV